MRLNGGSAPFYWHQDQDALVKLAYFEEISINSEYLEHLGSFLPPRRDGEPPESNTTARWHFGHFSSCTYSICSINHPVSSHPPGLLEDAHLCRRLLHLLAHCRQWIAPHQYMHLARKCSEHTYLL
ncbi:hypothetical protein FRC14_000438 [Serendipita sp. 396]|nr:hypothetical protein FRC14_000438 [Serendipita sp. 396]